MGDVPIFRICVFSPFLKQQKLGGWRREWLQPADPDPRRQAEQLGCFCLPEAGWLPLSSGSGGAGKKASKEGARPQRVPCRAARSVVVTEASEGPVRTPEWLEQGSGLGLEPSTPRWCPERDFPGLVLLETEVQVSPGPGPRPGESCVNC